ncbi:metallophosphoesterase [Variovorax sp. J31P207]|nr:metallophosphoesterase [Variovorax sp. J31P207]
MKQSVVPPSDESVRIQIVSDLHLELLTSRIRVGWHGIPASPAADLLVLAGDIGSIDDVLRMFGRWPVPVLYVLGNHEFYHQEMTALRRHARSLAQGTSVLILDNDEVGPVQFLKFSNWYEPRKERLAGLRAFGATLWTDYDYADGVAMQDWRQMRMGEAGRRLNDHRLISFGESVFKPGHALAEHQASVGWLADALSTPFDGRTVVITHHGPHAKSVHPRFRGDLLNCAFVSDLSSLLARADLWVHGHVHDSFDYQVRGCRVVANPRGYPRNAGLVEKPEELIFENPWFDPSLVVVV